MSIAYYELLCQEDLDVGVDTVAKRNPGGGSIVGTQIGIHSFAVGQVKVSTTWDPASLANSTSTTTTVSVPGAAVGDFVLVSFGANLSGLSLTGYVSSPNVVTVVLANHTGSVVNLGSATLSVLVFKSI